MVYDRPCREGTILVFGEHQCFVEKPLAYFDETEPIGTSGDDIKLLMANLRRLNVGDIKIRVRINPIELSKQWEIDTNNRKDTHHA